jgi:hypothetical protein
MLGGSKSDEESETETTTEKQSIGGGAPIVDVDYSQFSVPGQSAQPTSRP